MAGEKCVKHFDLRVCNETPPKVLVLLLIALHDSNHHHL